MSLSPGCYPINAAPRRPADSADHALCCRDGRRTGADRQRRGWTLIECLIALALTAILASQAVPAYKRYVMRGYRLAAVSALYEIAAATAQEAALQAQGGGSAPAGIMAPGGNTGRPTRDATPTVTSPPSLWIPSDHTRVYRLSTARVDGEPYFEAAPVADGPLAADACGAFVLTGDGERRNRRGAAGWLASDAAGRCWIGNEG